MDEIRLRTVHESDLDALEGMDEDPEVAGRFLWTGFRGVGHHRRRWEQDGYVGDDDTTLVVSDKDGRLLGVVVWRSVGPTRPRGCIEIGILVLSEHRGDGIGSVAQAALCEELFATTLVNRVQAITETDNVAEQRALERAGFTREGVLREYGFVRGG